MKLEPDHLNDEQRARIATACRAYVVHLRRLAENDGPHVSTPTRRQWREEANQYAEIAGRMARARGGRA